MEHAVYYFSKQENETTSIIKLKIGEMAYNIGLHSQVSWLVLNI